MNNEQATSPRGDQYKFINSWFRRGFWIPACIDGIDQLHNDERGTGLDLLVFKQVVMSDVVMDLFAHKKKNYWFL